MEENIIKHEVLNKPNQLLSLNPREKITVTQRKAYNVFLKHAQNLIKFEDFQGIKFEISSNILHEKAGISSKDTKYLKEELENLMGIIVEITDKDNKDNWEAFPILRYIKKEDDIYYYKLDETIIEGLKNQNFFTPLNLLTIKNLSSQYSVIFYELAIRYKKVKIPKMRIEEIRDLTYTQDVYKRFYDFEKRVLIPACKEITEKTDIKLTYETEKLGRKIAYIKFKMEKQEITLPETKAEMEELLAKDMFKDKELEEKIKNACKIKIDSETAKKIFVKYRKKDFDYLIYCLKKTEEKAIINPVAYFEKSIKESEIEYEAYLKTEQKKAELKKQMEELEKQLKEQEEEENKQKENKAKEMLKNKQSEEYQTLKSGVLSSLNMGFLEKGKYKGKSEEEIPLDLIEKYMLMSY